MGTISDKLERVLKTKKDIQNALVKNGKYVPDKLPFKYYPYLIDNMNIDGLVGMYYGKGLTNEELSKDPTWYDTSGNGNDLKFKNLSWKLNSGAGIWPPSFIGSGNDIRHGSVSNTKIVMPILQDILTQSYFGYWYFPGATVFDFNWFISGISDNDEIFACQYGIQYNNYGKVKLHNGLNKIHIDITDSPNSNYPYVSVYSNTPIVSEITIEVVPDYEGAICFNGIDDCAVCDNFPILTKDKGYTVMALRKWLTPETKTSNEIIVSNLYNADWSSINLGAFNCEVKYNNLNPKIINAISYSSSSLINVDENDLLFYQTSNNYNGNIIEVGNKSLGGSYLFVGSGSMSTFYANSAIYALCIIDHDTSDAEREIVINKWRQYYPELL